MPKYFVYILKSINFPNKTYIGFTNNLNNRLKEHNSGKSIYTNKYKPWEIQTYIAFTDKKKAKSFEEYLKMGSGYAFFKRRLI